MSLEGNLTAFGLSEILQLIAVQQKSGMLSISSQDRAKVLFFREGNIISTRDRRRKTKDPLKDYLTRYGILSREDLIRLMQISAQSKLDLTDIMVSEGFMSEEEMRRQYRNHIQEEVHDILTWEQCSYKFIPGNDIIDGIKTWGEFSIEGMLMESMRRIDEFPAALKLLPDLGARVSRTGESIAGKELTTNETVVYQLLAEERALTYLIARGKMPKYEVYEAVRHLQEKGLVAISLDQRTDDAEDAPGDTKKRRSKSKAARNPLPLAVALLLFLTAGVWGARTAAPHLQHLTESTGQDIHRGSISRNHTEARIRWMLEAYYAENGIYPETLAQLKKTGAADDKFLDRVGRYSFRYHLTANGNRYTLL